MIPHIPYGVAAQQGAAGGTATIAQRIAAAAPDLTNLWVADEMTANTDATIFDQIGSVDLAKYSTDPTSLGADATMNGQTTLQLGTTGGSYQTTSLDLITDGTANTYTVFFCGYINSAAGFPYLFDGSAASNRGYTYVEPDGDLVSNVVLRPGASSFPIDMATPFVAVYTRSPSGANYWIGKQGQPLLTGAGVKGIGTSWDGFTINGRYSGASTLNGGWAATGVSSTAAISEADAIALMSELSDIYGMNLNLITEENLLFSWNARSITGVADGSPVPSLVDDQGRTWTKSGAGNTLYVADSFDGQPGVSFTNAAGHFEHTAGISSVSTTGGTFYAIAKRAGAGGQDLYLTFGPASTALGFGVISQQHLVYDSAYRAGGSPSSDRSAVTVVIKPNGGSGLFDTYDSRVQNAVDLFTPRNGTFGSGAGSAFIGADAAGTGYFFEGELLFLAYYETEHTAAERESVWLGLEATYPSAFS